MKRIQIDKDFPINYIGLNDFIKNKQASGRMQDLADIQEIKKLLDMEKISNKKRGGIYKCLSATLYLVNCPVYRGSVQNFVLLLLF